MGRIPETKTGKMENRKELEFIIPEITRIKIKPLSVNEAWQGKRFKTDAYKSYENNLLLLLPKMAIPPAEMKIIFEFGMSNICSDIDNPVKPFLDVLQKKYWFNDRYVMEMEVKKVKTEKGNEYVKFAMIPIVK